MVVLGGGCFLWARYPCRFPCPIHAAHCSLRVCCSEERTIYDKTCTCMRLLQTSKLLVHALHTLHVTRVRTQGGPILPYPQKQRRQEGSKRAADVGI